MMVIKTLTAIAAGAMALGAAGAAQAQTSYGGYGETSNRYGGLPSACRNVQPMANGYVSAECPAEGGYRWSAIRMDDCRSAVSNRNGVLSCIGATASVGDVYGNTVQNTSGQQSGIGGLLAAIFGNSQQGVQTLDNDWSRGGQPLGQRRDALETRIDAGQRDGSLTRAEANRLRADYDDLARLEAQYASDGRFTDQERANLRDRYVSLSRQIGEERRDDQGNDVGDNNNRNWEPIASRRGQFDANLNAAVRQRIVNRSGAVRLRSDFQTLLRMEVNYRSNGLDARERTDLENRYLDLNRRMGVQAPFGTAGSWAEMETRIVAGERNRRITQAESTHLRAEHGDLVRLDAAWRRDGLDAEERTYLSRRFSELSAQLSLALRQ